MARRRRGRTSRSGGNGKLSIVKSIKIRCYPKETITAHWPVWALVKHNPVTVKEKNELVDDGPWIVPIVLAGLRIPDLYNLDVIEFHSHGKTWEGMCMACLKNIQCAVDGRGYSESFRCKGTKIDIVRITRRKNEQDPG